MPRFITVPGTHGRKTTADWWTPGSAFIRSMQTCDWHLLRPGDPFNWSGDVQGIPFLASGQDWQAAGDSLRWYCDDVAYDDRNIIGHSHALQCVLHAAAKGMQIRTLIDIAGPVRKDMLAIAEEAWPHIGFWLHVYDEGRFGDWTILGGQLFDGRFSLDKRHPSAHLNIGLKGIKHSKLLHSADRFHYFAETILPAVGVEQPA